MFEHPLLQIRVNQFFERLEAQIRQIIRENKIRDHGNITFNERLLANQLVAFYEGTLARFVRSGFKYLPTSHFNYRWSLLMGSLMKGDKSDV